MENGNLSSTQDFFCKYESSCNIGESALLCTFSPRCVTFIYQTMILYCSAENHMFNHLVYCVYLRDLCSYANDRLYPKTSKLHLFFAGNMYSNVYASKIAN